MLRLNRTLGRSGRTGGVLAVVGLLIVVGISAAASAITGVAYWLMILIVLVAGFVLWASLTWAFLVRQR